MKKLILLMAIILSAKSALYSKELNDSSLVEKRGWLVYYLGHVMFFEADIEMAIKDENFFSIGKKYENGLIVDYNGNANSFKSIAKCYSVKVLLQTDSITKKAEYISKESLCVIPVKVTLKMQPDSDQFDFAGISFKRNGSETTIEYWFHTNYHVREVELLRKKDKKKLK
jgi:hypothetical protein